MKPSALLLAALLPATLGAAPCMAASDLDDQARLLQCLDPGAELKRLDAEIVTLSGVARNKRELQLSAKSPAERARLGRDLSELRRLLAQDRLWAAVAKAEWERQQDIRAGKPFPGTRITLL